ncbi:MAG: PA14 domain-containing protein [Chloroflexota bacterium]
MRNHSIIRPQPFPRLWHWALISGILITLMVAHLIVPAASTAQSVDAPEPIPAFPGAEGGGAAAVGGRGGSVIQVTNLNDSGPGSLRAALEATGPRIVVFRVSGIIKVQSTLNIVDPYITVAGQTAPGEGVLISGVDIDGPPLYIGTHDVIIRYLKMATGRGSSYVYGNGDVVSMGEGGDVYNVIIDHSSLNWGNDENVALWADEGIARSVTFSNNIIAEALAHDDHSTGLIVGSNTMCEDMRDVDVVRNLFMHNNNRNPYVKIARARIVNNIVYNWGWLATQIAGGVKVDIVGNHYKAGADDQGRSEIAWRSNWSSCNEGLPGPPSIYLKGNKGPNQPNPDADNWDTMMEETFDWSWPGDPPQLKRVDRAYERQTPLDYGPFPVTVYDVNDLEDMLLDDVGASHRLNAKGEWVPNRDALDRRLIEEYVTGTGEIKQDENDAGGYPKIKTGTPYADSDQDGMPNQWETMHDFNPNQSDDANQDADDDGYTNIEEFLNGSNPGQGGAATPDQGIAYALFSNTTLSGTPDYTGVDAAIDFDWGSEAPAPGLPKDTFSVRWTGQIEPRYSERYTFCTRGDDGIRLWINGQQLINDWTDHAVTENCGAIDLTADQRYDLKLEYYENRGRAVVQLFWSSTSQPREIVPQSQLFSQ